MLGFNAISATPISSDHSALSDYEVFVVGNVVNVSTGTVSLSGHVNVEASGTFVNVVAGDVSVLPHTNLIASSNVINVAVQPVSLLTNQNIGALGYGNYISSGYVEARATNYIKVRTSSIVASLGKIIVKRNAIMSAYGSECNLYLGPVRVWGDVGACGQVNNQWTKVRT